MARCKSAKITGVAGYVPPRLLTNADLEKMVDTTNEWIMDRVGIRERHLADKGVAASDLAVEAVKKLQCKHPFDLQSVDLIVVGTVTPDMMYPSTACLVQHKLGMTNTWGFDVSAGCSGFLYSLNVGTKFIESGQYKKVLVIGSDVNSSMTDFTDRLRLHHLRRRRRRRPAGTRRGRRSRHHRSRRANRRHGRPVPLHAGRRQPKTPASHETVDKKNALHPPGREETFSNTPVKKMAEMTERVLAKNGPDRQGRGLLHRAPGQPGRIITTATRRAPRNAAREGDQSISSSTATPPPAGTIPLAMQTALDEKKLKKGDLVLLAAVGAGFTSGANPGPLGRINCGDWKAVMEIVAVKN